MKEKKKTNPVIPLTEQQKIQGRVAIADILVDLAEDIRTGKVELTNVIQEYPAHRYWSKERWEYFRLSDLTFTLTYFNVAARKAELARLEKYLTENPDAESHGSTKGES